MVTIRACRMLNATASTVAMPRPYRASAELQSDQCIKLDGVRLETNMPLKADRNNPGRHPENRKVNYRCAANCPHAERFLRSREIKDSLFPGRRSKVHTVAARPSAVIGDVDASCALAFLRTERSACASQIDPP